MSDNVAARLYDVFVHFMHIQFGGPKKQRTPTTKTLQEIAKYMRNNKARTMEKLCYALTREYLSNDKQTAKNGKEGGK